jgi:hypothetical protein
MRQIQEYRAELYDKMWKTKGARFNAYERLRRRQTRSFYATSLLSAYLIVLSLIEPFSLLPPTDSKIISFFSIAVSIILLSFVTLENAAEYNLKGNNFHNCAKDIGRIFNELHALIQKEDADLTKYEKIAEQYANILDQYDNHSPIDYEVHRTKHQKDFKLNFAQRQWILFRSNYLIDVHYFAIIIAPPVLFALWVQK